MQKRRYYYLICANCLFMMPIGQKWCAECDNPHLYRKWHKIDKVSGEYYD